MRVKKIVLRSSLYAVHHFTKCQQTARQATASVRRFVWCACPIRWSQNTGAGAVTELYV